MQKWHATRRPEVQFVHDRCRKALSEQRMPQPTKQSALHPMTQPESPSKVRFTL
jgi:hypothetical protein